jgi:hypothetical protein
MEFDVTLAGHRAPWRYRGSRAMAEWVESIARLFNDEQVPPPRVNTRHRRKGWVASTIRAILHNDAYVGAASFKRRRWVKMPGTNVRRPRKRDEAEILRREYPERRIIAPQVWEAAQTRLASVRARYTGKRCVAFLAGRERSQVRTNERASSSPTLSSFDFIVRESSASTTTDHDLNLTWNRTTLASFPGVLDEVRRFRTGKTIHWEDQTKLAAYGLAFVAISCLLAHFGQRDRLDRSNVIASIGST